MRALSLFSGIGGIDLAAEWAGIEVAAMCEIEPFAQKVLKKHWPNVPLFPDIRKLNKESLEQEGVIKPSETIELIYGGFPCQPFSIAGKRKGKEDDRDLWPEMFRVIQELKPTWIVGENVANFVNMELERTLVDLENEGYETQTFIIPAAGVDAKHQRNRTFVVAYNDNGHKYEDKEIFSRRNATRSSGSIMEDTGCTLQQGSLQQGTDGMEDTEQYANQSKRPSEMVPHSNSIRRNNRFNNWERGYLQNNFNRYAEKTKQKWRGRVNRSWKVRQVFSNTTSIRQQRQRKFIEPINTKENQGRKTNKSINECEPSKWQFEPNVGRVANGIPNRVDRLKGLGNAVVPQQIYPILKAIVDIEEGKIREEE